MERFQPLDQLLAAQPPAGALQPLHEHHGVHDGRGLGGARAPRRPGTLAQAGELPARSRGLVCRRAREGQEHLAGVTAGNLGRGAPGQGSRGEQPGHGPAGRQRVRQPGERGVAAQDQDRLESTRREPIGHAPRVPRQREDLGTGGAAPEELVGGRARGLGVRWLRGVDHREPPRSARRLAQREDRQRPGLLPETSRRVEDPGAGGLVLPGEEAERSHLRDLGRGHERGHLRLGARVEPGDEGEDASLPEEAPGRLDSIGPVGVVSGHHQLHLAAVDPAAPVERVEPAGEHRAHGEAHLGEDPGGRQDRADAQRVRADAGIEVVLDAPEVGGQAGQVLVGHLVARHGHVEAVAGRVQPLPDGAGQAGVGEGRVPSPPGVGVAVRLRELRPDHGRRSYPTLGPSLAVGAVAGTAGRHRAGKGRPVPAEPQADAAARRALAREEDALPGQLLRREIQGHGRSRSEQQGRGEEAGRDRGACACVRQRRSPKVREAVFTSRGISVVAMIWFSTLVDALQDGTREVGARPVGDARHVDAERVLDRPHGADAGEALPGVARSEELLLHPAEQVAPGGRADRGEEHVAGRVHAVRIEEHLVREGPDARVGDEGGLARRHRGRELDAAERGPAGDPERAPAAPATARGAPARAARRTPGSPPCRRRTRRAWSRSVRAAPGAPPGAGPPRGRPPRSASARGEGPRGRGTDGCRSGVGGNLLLPQQEPGPDRDDQDRSGEQPPGSATARGRLSVPRSGGWRPVSHSSRPRRPARAPARPRRPAMRPAGS